MIAALLRLLVLVLLLPAPSGASDPNPLPQTIAPGCSLLLLMQASRGEHRFPSALEAETLFQSLVREGEILDYRVWVWALRSNFKNGTGGLDRESALRDPPDTARTVLEFVTRLLDSSRTRFDNPHGKWRVRRTFDSGSTFSQAQEEFFRIALNEFTEYGLSRADFDTVFSLSAALRTDSALYKSAVDGVTSLLPALVEIADPQIPADLTPGSEGVAVPDGLGPNGRLALAAGAPFIGSFFLLALTDVSTPVHWGASLLSGTAGALGYLMHWPEDPAAPPATPSPSPVAEKPATGVLARLGIPADAREIAIDRIQATEFPIELLQALEPLVTQTAMEMVAHRIEDDRAYSFQRDYLPITLPNPLEASALADADVSPVHQASLAHMEASGQLAVRASAIREHLWGKAMQGKRTELAALVARLEAPAAEPLKRSSILQTLSSLARDFDVEAQAITPHIVGVAADLERLFPLIDRDFHLLKEYLRSASTDGQPETEIQRLDFLLRSKRQLAMAFNTVSALSYTQSQTTEMLTLRTDLTNRLRSEFASVTDLERPISDKELSLLKQILSLMDGN